MPGHVDALLVEDNPADADLVKHYLRADPVAAFLDDVDLTHVESLAAASRRLDATQYDVLLLDLGLPESEGVETLHRVTDLTQEVPVIVLTGLDDTAAAVEAIQSGAQDYLRKGDLDADRLVRSLRYAIERHKQERALARRNEQLDFFNSLLRHDMMNGLNVMMAKAAMLETELDEEELTDHAADIRTWGENIVDLTGKIRRILDTVSTEDDDSLETVALASVVETEADRAGSLTDRVEFTVDVSSDVRVLANDLLSDVVGNLLTNAVEHTDDPTQVAVTSEPAGPRVALRVADDGPGVPAERRSALFGRGQKGIASTGTGFGLFFVSSMVDSYGGEVYLEESEQGGAAFVVEFRRP